jgi:plasmid stabilization system protein ParE
MAYKVVWTLIANEDFEEIIHYLTERWKPEKAIDFVRIFYW